LRHRHVVREALFLGQRLHLQDLVANGVLTCLQKAQKPQQGTEVGVEGGGAATLGETIVDTVGPVRAPGLLLLSGLDRPAGVARP
jgi:hypothetical protein